MLNIISVEQAKQSILKRQPPDEFPVSQAVLDGIAKIFGEALTPEQAVTRILRDVRSRGDKALQEWSERLDNRKAEAFRVPAEKLSSALKSISDEELAAMYARGEAAFAPRPAKSRSSGMRRSSTARSMPK